MKAASLGKWKKNPRTITPEKQRILAKTLMVYGDLGGIVFNRKNKSLVSGHQRRDALAKGEITILEKFKKPTAQGTVALGFIEFEGERFSYREVSWSEKVHASAAIAANKSAGEWSLPDLSELLQGVDDPELTGFSIAEVDTLLAVPDFQEPDEKSAPKDKDADLRTCANCGAMIED